MIVVTLTWPEIMLAINAGIMRRVHAIRSGKAGVYGARKASAWDNDINGAIAEMGCAKWANVFWSGTVGMTTLPDVGEWQVRSKLVAGDRMVVRPDDPDDSIFISVLVDPPDVTLCGWMAGIYAKQEKWLREYPPKPPMYFVDESSLRPMENLWDGQGGQMEQA